MYIVYFVCIQHACIMSRCLPLTWHTFIHIHTTCCALSRSSRSLRIVTWWWERLKTRSIPTRFAKWTEQQMLLWWIWRALAASAEQDLHFALGTLGAWLVTLPWCVTMHTITNNLCVVSTMSKALVKCVVLALPMSTTFFEMFQIAMDTTIKLIHIVNTFVT